VCWQMNLIKESINNNVGVWRKYRHGTPAQKLDVLLAILRVNVIIICAELVVLCLLKAAR
jgi:hypothetical protein